MIGHCGGVIGAGALGRGEHNCSTLYRGGGAIGRGELDRGALGRGGCALAVEGFGELDDVCSGPGPGEAAAADEAEDDNYRGRG